MAKSEYELAMEAGLVDGGHDEEGWQLYIGTNEQWNRFEKLRETQLISPPPEVLDEEQRQFLAEEQIKEDLKKRGINPIGFSKEEREEREKFNQFK